MMRGPRLRPVGIVIGCVLLLGCHGDVPPIELTIGPITVKFTMKGAPQKGVPTSGPSGKQESDASGSITIEPPKGQTNLSIIALPPGENAYGIWVNWLPDAKGKVRISTEVPGPKVVVEEGEADAETFLLWIDSPSDGAIVPTQVRDGIHYLEVRGNQAGDPSGPAFTLRQNWTRALHRALALSQSPDLVAVILVKPLSAPAGSCVWYLQWHAIDVHEQDGWTYLVQLGDRQDPPQPGDKFEIVAAVAPYAKISEDKTRYGPVVTYSILSDLGQTDCYAMTSASVTVTVQ